MMETFLVSDLLGRGRQRAAGQGAPGSSPVLPGRGRAPWPSRCPQLLAHRPTCLLSSLLTLLHPPLLTVAKTLQKFSWLGTESGQKVEKCCNHKHEQ